MKKLKVYFKSDYFLPAKEFNLDDLEINQCEIGNRIFFLKSKDCMIIFAVPVDNLLFYEIVEEKENGSV